MLMWLSSTEPDITLWGGREGGAGAALQRGYPSSNSSTYASSRLKKRDGGLVEAGKGLLGSPVAVIRGQPGIVSHMVLNNRRAARVHLATTLSYNCTSRLAIFSSGRGRRL